MNKTTLCLDLGTKTGYAILDNKAQVIMSGTKVLATEAELQTQRETGVERTGDIRFKQLHEFIYSTIEQYEIQRLVFEDVIFATSQIQAQLWASLRAVIWTASITNNIEVQGVPVGTLKIFGAGTGKADKQQMKDSLQLKHPEAWEVTADDNEVDAIWIAYYAKAVDDCTLNWSSVWENRKKRKILKQHKAQLKRKVLKSKKVALIATSTTDLTALLLSVSIKMTKSEILRIAKLPITKNNLQNVNYLLDHRHLIAECSKTKVTWKIQ